MSCSETEIQLCFFISPNGRLKTKVDIYYESYDSLVYKYDGAGVLTGLEGTWYELDMEAAIIIRCRPDGTYIEKWEHWASEDAPDNVSTIYIRYNSHGQVILWRNSIICHEYEIEYWERATI